MSEPESFVSRWSRLKRESAVEDGNPAVGSHSAERTVPVEDASRGALPITPDLVDTSTLPPIESIGPGSTISVFLQAGVPAELTRAALRSAWVTDPAIRGFVEIADNQWDFNEQGAILGFGALGAADHARDLVTRALGNLNNVMTATPAVNQGGATVDSLPSVVQGPRITDKVWRVGAATSNDLASVTALGHVAPDASSLVQPGVQTDVSEPHSSLEVARCHGSALPK